MIFRTPAGNRRALGAAVILMTSLLLCLTVLRQAVERTPISQDKAGFKFSKTLELPHKKAGTVAVAAVRRPMDSLGPDFSEHALPLNVIPAFDDLLRRPSSSRAPPLV